MSVCLFYKADKMISPSEYETLRSIHRSNSQVSYLSIDTERWENTRSYRPKLIELGWSALLPASVDPSRKQQSTHFIIRENEHLKNFRYVPDERDAFGFGSSTRGSLKRFEESVGHKTYSNGTRTASLSQVAAALRRVINYLASLGSVLLLFHDATGDLQELASIGINTRNWRRSSVPPSPTSGSIYVVDTRHLFARIQKRENGQGGSLKHLTEVLDVSTSAGPLHNAGNDAYYTLKCFVEIVYGPPLVYFQSQYKRYLRSTSDFH